MLLLWCIFNTNRFLSCVKLIGFLASAVNVVSSYPCVDPLPRIKISLYSLSLRTDELISVPKIKAFFLLHASVNENYERESNPLP